MLARLTVTDPNGNRIDADLPKATATLGNTPADAIRIPALPPGMGSLLEFTFQSSRSTWTVRPMPNAGPVWLNGGELQAGTSGTPLQAGDELRVAGLPVRFQLAPAPPLFNGQPATVIPMPAKGTELVIGRSPETPAASPNRVDLDLDDHRVSSEHVKIRFTGRDPEIEDVSRLGTTLNGSAFSKAPLVYGDRFQIGHYVFEYDGRSLRWLDDAASGTIEAVGLTRRAGGRTILNKVSLHIRPGEFVGILGGSGQGKSTLLNALCGIVPASEGEVRISGQELRDRKSIRDLGVGYVPQDDIVHKELTVDDALILAGRLRLNLPLHAIKARIDRIVDQLGLVPHRHKRVFMLSGGQRKRVSIGIELLSNPSVLFLDEPSSGLDPATEENLMSLLQRLALSGITIVCTTHVLQKAYLFDRLLFIQDGRLVFAGNSDEARAHFLGGETTHPGQVEAPLEKIYAILADGAHTGEELERAFQQSPYAASAKPQAVTARPVKADQARKVPSWVALATLLKRQWKVLIADPLNLAFLLAQAVVIAVLIAWVSDDIGMRMFLGVVASMWFGCSNAAQQIIGEIMIFRRERVCGLGLQTYYASKGIFLCGLTAVQTLLLFLCAHLLGHLWHPVDFNADEFDRRLVERSTTVAGMEDPSAASTDDFDAVGEDDPVAAGSTAKPKTAAAAPAAPAVVAPVAPPKASRDRLATLARWFYLEPNLVESGPRDLLLSNGERARGPDHKLLTFAGLPIRKVLLVTLGLRIGGLLSAGMIGVVLGLAISALVRSPTQAVMWVPLILIPQILFGGFVIPYPEMTPSARTFSRAVPSFAAQRLIDVSHIYGRATPFLANRTKTPVFLTTDGAKETLKWSLRGTEVNQDYDKISPFNRSMQNLLVDPETRGQHKQETTPVSGTFTTIPRDSVKERDDVVYRKGTVYSTLAPAFYAAVTLGLWWLVSYLLTLGGLASKQSGT